MCILCNINIVQREVELRMCILCNINIVQREVELLISLSFVWFYLLLQMLVLLFVLACIGMNESLFLDSNTVNVI